VEKKSSPGVFCPEVDVLWSFMGKGVRPKKPGRAPRPFFMRVLTSLNLSWCKNREGRVWEKYWSWR